MFGQVNPTHNRNYAVLVDWHMQPIWAVTGGLGSGNEQTMFYLITVAANKPTVASPLAAFAIMVVTSFVI